MRTETERQLEELRRTGAFATKLTRADLLLLLQHDDDVRAVVRRVVAEEAPQPSMPQAHSAQTTDSLPDTPTEGLQPPQPPAPNGWHRPSWTPPAGDSLREALAPELALLAAVRADSSLHRDWLDCDVGEHEARQLVRLIAVASQWDRLLQLWDRLAERCKASHRPATAQELQLLKHGLALHNLLWNGPQAQLQPAIIGEPCDERIHERGSARGAVVRAQWLPGLSNAAGQLQKRPLVST